MIIYKDKDKEIKKIKLHKWFAWYPVWAWESDKLHGVWLQWIWRTNGYNIKYRHYLIKK